MRIFTHIPYKIKGAIKTGKARFHVLIQVDLHNFDQNILRFENILFQ